MEAAQLFALAEDRELVTPEIHYPPNDFYGHAHILKQYTGLPLDQPLKVAIQHGFRRTDLIWISDLTARVPVFLCSNEEMARAFEKQTLGPEKAVPIGFPMMYLPNFGAPPPPDERCLVAFPTHSTHTITKTFDVDAFARRIEGYGQQFDRILICVYWKNVLDGLAQTLIDAGFECTTAGHMFDPEFLLRLSSILQSATALYTNELGTQVLYATLMNIPVWIDKQDIRVSAESGAILQRDGADGSHHRHFIDLARLFAEPRDKVSEEQFQYVADLTGLADFKSKDELREILAIAEAMYPSFERKHFVNGLIKPKRWRHFAHRLSSRIQRTIHRPESKHYDVKV